MLSSVAKSPVSGRPIPAVKQTRGKGNDLTALSMEAGRRWAAERPEIALEALRRSRSPWGGQIPLLEFPGGKATTREGSKDQPGNGQPRNWTPTEYGQRLDSYAEVLISKAQAPVVVHGISITGERLMMNVSRSRVSSWTQTTAEISIHSTVS